MSSSAANVQDDSATIAELREENAALRHQLDWFKRQLFGRRSEKRLIEANPDQPVLDGWHTPGNETPAPQTEKITYTRRKKQRGDNDANDSGLRFDDTVPVQTIRCAAPELDGPDADQYAVISEKETFRLAQQPGSYVVLKYVRPVLKRKSDGKLRTTPAPAGLWAGSVADVSVVAGLLVDKFVYHQPLYRQHQRLSREGIQLARATLTTWAHKAIDLLMPIFDAQQRSVLQSKVLAVDETPIKAGRKKKGQMRLAWYWPMYGDQDEVVFTYSRTRGHQHLLDTLSGFEGTLLTDGHGAYTRYAGKRPTLTHAQCWAHTRREFIRAEKAEPEAVAAALEQIGLLYRIEAQLSKDDADSVVTGQVREDQARPVARRFFAWCDEQARRMDLVPSNPLSKALKYAMKREAALSVYLADPQVAIDTNHLERTLRVIPMGRKAWQFCWSEVGAEKVGVVQSLLTTCRLHDVHPYHYLVDVLQRVAEHPMSRVDELTPRNWKNLFADNPLRSDVNRTHGQ